METRVTNEVYLPPSSGTKPNIIASNLIVVLSAAYCQRSRHHFWHWILGNGQGLDRNIANKLYAA